jgi:hypothetical protein
MTRMYRKVTRLTAAEMEARAADARRRGREKNPPDWDRMPLAKVTQAARDGDQGAADALMFAAFTRPGKETR